MKKLILIMISLISLSYANSKVSSCDQNLKIDCEYCCQNCNPSQHCFRLAIEPTIGSEGVFSIGLTGYSYYFEGGLSIGGEMVRGDSKYSIASPAIFFGGRYHIFDKTIFAYGLEFSASFGKITQTNYTWRHHNNTNDFYILRAAPYISFEQFLSNHVMLVMWIDPYSFGYEKIEHTSSYKIHEFFRTGGIGLAYLF